MAPRHASLDGTLRTFATGGASAHAPADTLEAFALAEKLGADGLSCDVRLTADGTPVMSQTSRIGSRLRRRRISGIDRSDLPEETTTLDQLYQAVDPAATPLLLMLSDAEAFEPVLAAAGRAGPGAEEHLWLASSDLETLTAWRSRTTARLVSSIRLSDLDVSPEQWAAALRERGIDGLDLPHGEWTGGLVILLHRFDRYALARGARHERELASVIDAGIDAVSSAHVDRMAAVAELYYPDR